MSRRILLTGFSGFLGYSISEKLTLKATYTLGRRDADVICDLATQIPKLSGNDIVIHAAGKAHSVPKTEKEKQEFFNVNVTGTQNLLKGLEQAPSLPKSFVFISSVAVYGLDKGTNIPELHPLNAKDPYGLSKIQAEEIVQEWCKKNNVICTIFRLPLLVGEKPPGNLGAMINAIKKGYYLNVGGGRARKSMVMAEDVAKFIIPASEVGGIYNLTDGFHPSFSDLSNKISTQLGKRNPLNIPTWLAKMLATIGDFMGEKSPFNTYKLSKITSDLTFNDDNARKAFAWMPKNVLEELKL